MFTFQIVWEVSDSENAEAAAAEFSILVCLAASVELQKCQRAVPH